MKEEVKIKLSSILSDSNYFISLFTNKELEEVEKLIFEKSGKPHIKCLIRDKDIQLKPEEIVRQLYINKLLNHYNYPKELIELEKQIQFGREIDQKRADIVVFKDDKITPAIIIEVKAPI